MHDQEAINLAFEVAQKQEAMRVEMEDLRTQLESKLALQQENLNATKTAYEAFNKYLRDDTKATANEMIASLASVNAMLKDTIALKAKAGIASSTPIEGAKAEGGRVDAGKTYLV